MSRRTNGVIESTMAGIRVRSVSNRTMFQGAELPGAAPGSRPGKEVPGAGCGRAQSRSDAARSTGTKLNERSKNEVRKPRVIFLLRCFRHFFLPYRLRLLRRCRIRLAVWKAE